MDVDISIENKFIVVDVGIENKCVDVEICIENNECEVIWTSRTFGDFATLDEMVGSIAIFASRKLGVWILREYVQITSHSLENKCIDIGIKNKFIVVDVGIENKNIYGNIGMQNDYIEIDIDRRYIFIDVDICIKNIYIYI